jgi:hypothetical protein
MDLAIAGIQNQARNRLGGQKIQVGFLTEKHQ